MKTIIALGIVLFALMAVGCDSSTSNDENATTSTKECQEPENPYSQGTGHYAGYEWAEQHDPASCGNNSQSFTEGCEEYQAQEEAYQDCETKK